MLLGKPSGITLAEHVANVLKEARNLLAAFPNVGEKYARLTEGLDFTDSLVDAVMYHDEGKKHPQWQNACKSDHQNFKAWQAQNGGTVKDYERQMPNEAGRNLMKANIRHEIASLIAPKEKELSIIVKVAIAAHHAKLSVRHRDKWIDNEHLRERGEALWNMFQKESVRGLEVTIAFHLQFASVLKKYPLYSGTRSWLMTADQRASAAEAGDFITSLRNFDYKFPHPEKRSVQLIVEQHHGDEFLLMRAPTGAGKTDASMLWAQKQIENGRATRMVIAMPTRFTSNALSINVAASISKTGLYHSSAWFTRFEGKVKSGEILASEARNDHEFARRLLTPVTVCTIDHLLMALTLTREDHHSILFNLMNSCLVIDEADFYDEFTQANILVLLEALFYWKVPVMLMSASLPEASRTFYEKSGYSIPEIREDASDLERKRCEVLSVTQAESIDDLDDLLEIGLKSDTLIVYANTVARAMDYYNWFKKRGKKPIMYHSRFTEGHKLKKEIELLAALGKDGKRKGIAILTQIGEMSVNISSDVMVSDICPVDRLVQRAGRLCRFDNRKVGKLHIVTPMKNGAIYPAPYGTFKRPDWTPSRALVETESRINVGDSFSAGNFVNLINEVYPDESVFAMKAKANADNLREYFVNNWMITGCELNSKDAESATYWKSRDIEANTDVFVALPTSIRYSNYMSFQSEKISLAISVPVYLVEMGLKSFSLSQKEITVDENTVTITFVQNPEAYSYELGLNVGVKFDNYL
jgi:CRISPR-associated endonuclease/helicase Cas3